MSKTTTLAGSKAPSFTLRDQNGSPVKLRDFLGKKIVLYFYVRDDTPGCTRQACEFRDSMDILRKRNVVVLGISLDTVDSHRRFAEKHNLTFPLLADEDASVAKRYGVWTRKNLYGRIFYGVVRSTFVIDEKGWVVKEFRRVRADCHLERLLKEI